MIVKIYHYVTVKVVVERWKRLVGEFFCGGGILFGGEKVEKYQKLRYFVNDQSGIQRDWVNLA